MERLLVSVLLGVILWTISASGQCVPRSGCIALAFYNISLNEQLSSVYLRFNTNLTALREYSNIQDENVVLAGQIVRIPFTCSCQSNRLSHTFQYQSVNSSDTADIINQFYYHALSEADQITSPSGSVLYVGQAAFVPVNCSCGDPNNPRFGLFMTYPVQQNDNKNRIAANFNTTVEDLQLYNPSVNLDTLPVGVRLFIPAALLNGTYPQFRGDPSDDSGGKVGVVAGVSAGAAVLVIGVVSILWFCYRRRKGHRKVRYSEAHLESGLSSAETKPGVLLHASNGSSRGGGLSDFAVDKSVEFSYEELAAATDNFNISNKIGEGGYGLVYYGEIRNQKLAIKKMNLQATREFLSEIKVLTHVHHTNLVQLIGYCTSEDSLFLAYEYIDNGTLAHHLRGSGSRLSWNQRIQIALDAARGLEYIHEHTKPTYIHRDVKSPNILIDRNFRAKVADFGLTKLTESVPGGPSVSLTQPTRLVGTFGYMSPEYARFGDVSPKIDVYSYGVVLFEIISAKDAIVRTVDSEDSEADPGQRVLAKGLVTLFDGVLKGPNAEDNLKDLVDPALGTNYPSESAWKLAKLAEACTQEAPENRPTMRAVVVALMTLCSSTQELDFSSNYSDAHIRDLVTGR